jgi:hypothetical protein
MAAFADTAQKELSRRRSVTGVRMSLAYCSKHERLFVVAQGGWLPFVEEEVNQIEYLYELLAFPALEVREHPCDQCVVDATPPAKLVRTLQVIN